MVEVDDCVACAVCEAVEDTAAPPSIPSRVLSSAKVAETPEELLQAEDGVPNPAIKFTAMH